jgi:hypothetical protein
MRRREPLEKARRNRHQKKRNEAVDGIESQTPEALVLGSGGVTDARGGRANGFGGLQGPIAHLPLSLAGRDGRAVVETKAALFN